MNYFWLAFGITNLLWLMPVPKYETFQCVVAPCNISHITLIEKFISLAFGGI